MITPRVDKLLEHTDTHYAAVVRRGEAGPPDQRLLPLPLRGRLRRVHAADGRGSQRELPHHRPRGDGGGQAEVRVQGLARRRASMARILLGVSGGIAAYKSLELARLATKEGHAVRVLMTPAGAALHRRRLLRGHRRRAGADRRVRARPGPRSLPRRPGTRARPDRPPGGGRQHRRLPDRPRLGEHDRQARRRDRRLDGHHLVPGLLGSPPGRAGDERPHVPGPGDPGRTSPPCASAA